MRDAMHRGGPDDAGTYIDQECHVHLGHRRLSFIDLSAAGHQPMSILGDKIQIIYNGELYNFKELRKELEVQGHRFRSHSDTEVILYAYLQWGTDCFSRFNGMYAMALWDRRTQDLILARDHAAIKPLYYSIQDDKLYFASELKAFKALKPDWPERKDWKIYFLAFGHLPEPITTLETVIPLNKGSWLKFNVHTGQYTIQSFITTHHKKSITSVEEAQSKIKITLEQAVQRHLISDAPIGLFLSGGIDSSLLTLLASQPSTSSNLKTLSIYFEEEKYSEKKYQDIIIQKTGVHHQSFLVTAQEFNRELPQALEAMDSPSTDAINTYFISKYAHEYGLKAVLSGVGSDELFGGYPSMQQSTWYNQIKKLPSAILSLSDQLTKDKYRKISFIANKSSTGEYLFYRGLHDTRTIANILGVDEIEVNTKLNLLLPVQWNGEDHKEKASYLEYNLYMQNQLLKDADYMSMWHSLEIRVPFLDKELVDLVHSIPSHIRFQSNQPKGLLIDSFKHILPEAIWNRPKQGFTFPFAIWLKENEWAKPVNKMEEKYYKLFELGRMSWGRYWGVKLCEAYH
jgi:asparagine synthase (glutamine-hydrolysing)